MKIIHDDDMPLRLKKIFIACGQLGEDTSEHIVSLFFDKFNNDDDFGCLNQSEVMSSILKTASIIFLRLLEFSHRVGNQFPDSETNYQELFEEALAGLRKLTRITAPGVDHYVDGIKKIKVVD